MHRYSINKAKSGDFSRSPKPSIVFVICDIPSVAKDKLSIAASSRTAGSGLADESSNLSRATIT